MMIRQRLDGIGVRKVRLFLGFIRRNRRRALDCHRLRGLRCLGRRRPLFGNACNPFRCRLLRLLI